MSAATNATVVLREDVARDAIDDLAREAGWQLSNIIAASERHPAQVIFSTTDADTYVFVVEDARLGAVYLTAVGPTAGACSATIQKLAHYSREDVEALVAEQDAPSIRRGLCLMALLVSEPEPHHVAALRRGLAHDDAQMRSSALTACTYAPWPAVREAVEHVANSDPQPMLRASATQVLSVFFGGA